MSLDLASLARWPKAQEQLRFNLRIIHCLALRTKLLSPYSLFIKGTEFCTVACCTVQGSGRGIDFQDGDLQSEHTRSIAWNCLSPDPHCFTPKRERGEKKIYHDTHSCRAWMQPRILHLFPLAAATICWIGLWDEISH